MPPHIGAIFWLAAQNSGVSEAIPIYWRSTSIKRKITTIMDAETIAIQFSYNIGQFLKGFLVELGLGLNTDPVCILNDNNSTISHIKTTNTHKNPRLL